MSAVLNKLNIRLVNDSYKFLKGIDPKDISSNAMFSNVMLDENIKEQIDLELSQSYKLFKNKVKRFVGTINITNIEELFTAYISAIDISANNHIAQHVELMTTNKHTKSKWFNVAMTELITAQLTTTRYVELNHIAYIVGKSLINKEHNGDVTIALSLGANILEFLRSINIIDKVMKSNAEKHLIASIKVSKAIDIPQSLIDAGINIRANSPMLCKPLEHSPLNGEGGRILQRAVMLNGKKLDHGFAFYRAVNYLNSQPLKLRVDNNIINDWFSTERFYADDLTELKGEKTKVLNDLALFQNKRFYITYASDERGRLYTESNYLNPQGDSYQKAMFIGEEEVLSELGINALKIALVNEVYSDKITREEALEWYELNQGNIQLSSPLSKVYYRDLQLALQGKPVGSILHQDMTNSGLGIYSLLGRDELGASLTNLLFNGKLADAYKALADALNKEFNITNLNRHTVKKAFMVFLYGSGKNLLISSDIDDTRYANLMEAILVNGLTLEIDEVWDKFCIAMESIAPAAIKLMNLVYKFKTKDSKYNWVMPDGFIVDLQVKSKTPTEYKGWSVGVDGKTHSHTINVIENLKDSKYDKSLAPHIVHSIDAFILREIVRRCELNSIPLYTIHDSFGTTPNSYFELNQVVREVLADVLEMNLLEDILGQLDSSKLAIAQSKNMLPKGNLSKEDILNAVNAVR